MSCNFFCTNKAEIADYSDEILSYTGQPIGIEDLEDYYNSTTPTTNSHIPVEYFPSTREQSIETTSEVVPNTIFSQEGASIQRNKWVPIVGAQQPSKC